MRPAPTVVAAILLLGACGARTGVPSPTSEEPTEGVTPASAPVDPTIEAPIQYEAPQDACMTSSGSAHAYLSEADLQSLLVGRWMLCNPGTPNAYWSAAGVGLDLLADGRCYGLFRPTGSQIVRDEETDHVWRYTAVPGDGVAFDMVFVGGGDPTFHSKLEDNPRKLVMDDGQKQYTFAPAQ